MDVTVQDLHLPAVVIEVFWRKFPSRGEQLSVDSACSTKKLCMAIKYLDPPAMEIEVSSLELSPQGTVSPESQNEALGAFCECSAPPDSDSRAYDDVIGRNSKSLDHTPESNDETVDVTGISDSETVDVTGDSYSETVDVTGDSDSETVDVTGISDSETVDVTGDSYSETVDVTGDSDSETGDITGDSDSETVDVTGDSDSEAYDHTVDSDCVVDDTIDSDPVPTAVTLGQFLQSQPPSFCDLKACLQNSADIWMMDLLIHKESVETLENQLLALESTIPMESPSPTSLSTPPQIDIDQQMKLYKLEKTFYSKVKQMSGKARKLKRGLASSYARLGFLESRTPEKQLKRGASEFVRRRMTLPSRKRRGA